MVISDGGQDTNKGVLIAERTDMLYQSTGILRYMIDNSGRKLILRVDQDLVNYYRSLMPKYIRTQPQAFPAHISVVRKEYIIHNKMPLWGKYEGEEVQFSYDNHIHNGTVYYWLNAWCNRLEEIRVELGLPVSSLYTRPPDGFDKTFHITIGNLKNET